MKNHIALKSCSEIAEIMLPKLMPHGIKVFNYYKIYDEGEVIRLSSDYVWTQHYFKKNYLSTLTLPPSYLSKDINYFLWLMEDCPEMLLDAALNFDTANGITIAERHDDYVEFFCFGSTLKNTRIVNHFYLNHLEQLKQYCSYFKDQAQFILKMGEKNKLLLPDIKSNTIEETVISHPKIKLSKRQYDCAHLLLRGMKYKEMAQILNLSSRTVESYVNDLKDKLKCQNKAELIIKLMRVNMPQYLMDYSADFEMC